MTREIALHCMKSASQCESELCEECPIYGETGSDHCFEDALQYVIGMLEQEPCDDAISRKKAICVISACDGKSAQIEALEQLPPVTQKTGKWLYKEITDDYRVTGQCSECKERRIIDNYCPNCGAKMESEE